MSETVSEDDLILEGMVDATLRRWGEEPCGESPYPEFFEQSMASLRRHVLALCRSLAVSPQRRVEELEAEAAKLRALVEARPAVKALHYTPEDGIEVQVEHWAVKHLAASCWQTFDEGGGVNFVTTTLYGHPRGPIEVTLRPCWGGKKTASQALAELRQENAELRDRLAFLEQTTKALAGAPMRKGDDRS